MVSDPGRYDYSAIIDRPPLSLPNNARLAIWFAPNVEHYEYLPPENPQRNPWAARPHPDSSNYSWRDYGNRMGVWRMFELFDKHGIRGTVSQNVAVFDHFPEIAEAMVARDWDYMSHGIYNTRYAFGMDEELEWEMIRDVISTVKRHTGKMISGWLGPALSTTLRTPDLLAKAGVKYWVDYFHDDEPGEIKTETGRLISVPYSIEINDAIVLGMGQKTGAEFGQMIKDQFDVLYAEGATHPKVMAICLHPYLINTPSRQKYLDEALTYIRSFPDVWLATGEEIADHYLATVPAPKVAVGAAS
ncbi:MAG: polysaccharide deacetylase family protein [bacterium]